MSIQEKQPRIWEMLRKSIEKGQLVHALLFEGEKGTGKKEMAKWLAQSYFCQNGPIACGHCHNCQRVLAEEHPDVHFLQPDGQSIKISQVAAIKSYLGKSGLEQSKQFLIVEQAEKMTVQSANSLLKFIEEPTGQLQIVFLTENKEQILPTIQSRCQILHFTPFSLAVLQNALTDEGVPPMMASLLSELTNDLDRALTLYQDQWFNELKELMDKWVQYLVRKDPYAFVFVQQSLVKMCRDKKQQETLYDLLIAYFHQLLTVTDQQQFPGVEKWHKEELSEGLAIVLSCQEKWRFNVAFQATLEQLVIKIVGK
ncbi:DNA polymerase III subunit delta' [Vagococcus elongatus]|uniref:DNA polymerase III subunit delta n=1 Tax=Vagococcus elongatus TaxID=180344 RepID=A0A430APC8_9ENTE|nr:DNA polymerase III subunit delta' [Vagococcus elongatus]RSU09833.1 DNA polymerase III subunit delta' [Vagococcus elongatus]